MAEVKVIGCMDHTLDNTFESANRVYDVNGCCPTLSTCSGGGIQPKMIDCEYLGYIENGTGKHQSNTVYGTDGTAPAITTIEGGGTQQIKIVDAQCLVPKRTEYGKEIRKSYESHEVYEQRKNMTELEPRTDNLTNTLTTVQKDNLILEQKTIKIRQATKDGFIECPIGGVADLSYPTSLLRRGRVQGNGNISPTITTGGIPDLIEFGNPDFYHFLYEIDGEIYLIRIRKLTPRECWRLMSFTDEDFDKAQKVNSNTQLYKQAGNSIVVKVLESIFRQML